MFKIINKRTGDIRKVCEIGHKLDDMYDGVGNSIEFLTYDKEYKIWQYVPANEWALFDEEDFIHDYDPPCRPDIPLSGDFDGDDLIGNKTCPKCHGDDILHVYNLERAVDVYVCADCKHRWEVDRSDNH